MFAVVRTGGKQYSVSKDAVIEVEKLEGKVGDTVTLSDVLSVATKVGTPTVQGASVSAEIVGQIRGDKVLIFKKRRRHNSRRKNGHRQSLTQLKILSIKA